MFDIGFWTFTPENVENAERFRKGYIRLLDDPPPRFNIPTYDRLRNFHPQEGRLYFVVGFDLDNPLGYAHCGIKHIPEDEEANVGKMSSLYGWGCEPYISHLGDNRIDRGGLRNYPIYSKYRGKGSVLTLSMLEVFPQRIRLGSMLLDYIKSQGFELIEGEVYDEDSMEWLQFNGFEDTELNFGKQVIMAWHNPEYGDDNG